MSRLRDLALRAGDSFVRSRAAVPVTFLLSAIGLQFFLTSHDRLRSDMDFRLLVEIEKMNIRFERDGRLPEEFQRMLLEYEDRRYDSRNVADMPTEQQLESERIESETRQRLQRTNPLFFSSKAQRAMQEQGADPKPPASPPNSRQS
jgi:hypothetical protein